MNALILGLSDIAAFPAQIAGWDDPPRPIHQVRQWLRYLGVTNECEGDVIVGPTAAVAFLVAHHLVTRTVVGEFPVFDALDAGLLAKRFLDSEGGDDLFLQITLPSRAGEVIEFGASAVPWWSGPGRDVVDADFCGLVARVNRYFRDVDNRLGEEGGDR